MYMCIDMQVTKFVELVDCIVPIKRHWEVMTIKAAKHYPTSISKYTKEHKQT